MTSENTNSVKDLSNKFSTRLVVLKDLQLVEHQYFHPALKIQRWFRGIKIRKEFLQIKKKHRYRYFILKEIIDTEAVYVQDLKQLADQIIFPLQEENILRLIEIKKMFINMKSIIGLNSAMLDYLQKQFKSFSPYQETLKGIQGYILYFKLYFEYCNGFVNARQMVQTYMKTNVLFKNFIKERIKNFQTDQLIGIIVKPVQRLPKYVLLFKDLLKHTDKDHPDYKNIESCLTSFLQINDHNNEMMIKQLGTFRLFELQKNFGDPNNLAILDAKQQFKFEESSTILINKAPKEMLVYGLSNMILFVQRMDDYKQKYYCHVQLDENSFIKDQEDSKYFQNLFQLVGKNDTIQFTCENQENKEKLMKLFNDILQNLKTTMFDKYQTQGIKKPTFPVHVSILGTDERNLGLFTQFTIYIAQISIEQINTKVFVRYSEIQTLENEIRKLFPQIRIPRMISNQWNNKNTIVIEDRKLQIEKFLQIILNAPEIRQKPTYILQILHLPDNFYELPIIEATQEYIREKGKTSYASILKASQSKINLLSIKNRKNVGDQTKEVFVYTLEGEHLSVQVKNYTRAQEVVWLVGEQLNLKSAFDFKLFLLDERNVNSQRVIDDEELILQLIEPRRGFLEYVSWKLFPSKYKLLFKKYIYFSPQIEDMEMKQDSIRLNLIASQIFDEIKNLKYHFLFNEYCLICALYLYIKYPECRNQEGQNVRKKLIKEFLNKQIYKEVSSMYWRNNTNEMLMSVSYEIDEIQRKQEQMSFSASTNQIYENKECLAEQILVNAMKFNPLFGMSVFSVDLSRESQSLSDLYQFFYLGVNCEGIVFLTPSKKQVFKQIKLYEISEVKVYPFQIVLVMNETRYRLNSQHAYQVIRNLGIILVRLISSFKNINRLKINFDFIYIINMKPHYQVQWVQKDDGNKSSNNHDNNYIQNQYLDHGNKKNSYALVPKYHQKKNSYNNNWRNQKHHQINNFQEKNYNHKTLLNAFKIQKNSPFNQSQNEDYPTIFQKNPQYPLGANDKDEYDEPQWMDDQDNFELKDMTDIEQQLEAKRQEYQLQHGTFEQKQQQKLEKAQQKGIQSEQEKLIEKEKQKFREMKKLQNTLEELFQSNIGTNQIVQGVSCSQLEQNLFQNNQNQQNETTNEYDQAFDIMKLIESDMVEAKQKNNINLEQIKLEPFIVQAIIQQKSTQDNLWQYIDRNKKIQGPFSSENMNEWYKQGYLKSELQLCWNMSGNWVSLGIYLIY